MTTDLERVNLKVLLFDTDFFALRSLYRYLAYDRRTRVTHLSETLEDMWIYLESVTFAEQPDVILFDADHIGTPEDLMKNLRRLLDQLPEVMILCTAPQLGQLGQVSAEMVEAAAKSGARGFFVKQDLRFQVAWAIALVYTLQKEFVITRSVATTARKVFDGRVFRALLLPPQIEFADMTERIRQATELCVVEGLPANLAADEMGISLHTVRGYVKEGYRIMEDPHDGEDFPVDMTPQERAFMRFTSFKPIAPDGDEGVD